MADVVGLHDVEDVKRVFDNCEESVKKSSPHSFQFEAGSFITEAPVLDVITNFLKLTNFTVLEANIKKCFACGSPVFIGRSMKILTENMTKIVDWSPHWVNPVTEAVF